MITSAEITMMTSSNGNISALLAFVRGIHRSPVNSPHKGRWLGALMFSLISAWNNSLANDGDAGDLRRHRPHYDVIVMTFKQIKINIHQGYYDRLIGSIWDTHSWMMKLYISHSLYIYTDVFVCCVLNRTRIRHQNHRYTLLFLGITTNLFYCYKNVLCGGGFGVN